MAVAHRAKQGLTSVNLRFESSQKKRVEDAASIMGMSLTQFAKTALLDRAQEVVQKHSMTILSERDRDIFLAALDADTKPSAGMRRAAARYRAFKNAK